MRKRANQLVKINFDPLQISDGTIQSLTTKKKEIQIILWHVHIKDKLVSDIFILGTN
jgi:hypothetical protein